MTAERATGLCIVRHGETARNFDHRVQGQLDIPLNDTGLRQAEAVGRALAGETFDVIYSSDLTRTRQTAAPAAQRLGMEVRLDAGLRERHYGMFQHLTYAEVKVKYAAEYARFAARDPDFDFGSGESLHAFRARCLETLARIAGAHPGAHILVFTHGGVLDELYRHVHEVPMSAPREFGIPNCGLSRVEFALSRWQIRKWADVAHLERALDDLR